MEQSMYLKRFNSELIKTLKFVAAICEKYNLRYFACGGTCIGAIRHKNIIPWDDDIDIFMPRDDYYKLISLKEQMNGTGFSIVSPFDKGYYFPFSKVINTNTTIWEHRENPFLIGAYVDIFPLYGASVNRNINDTVIQYRTCLSRFMRSNQSYSLNRVLDAFMNGQIKNTISFLRSKFIFRNTELYRQEFIEFEKTMDDSNCDRLVSYTSSRYGLESYNPKWFQDSLEVPFADTRIRIPIGYDEYLRYVYGDYMQLPPEEKRVPDHHKYYVNLNEGLTIDEVRQRINKGETCVY